MPVPDLQTLMLPRSGAFQSAGPMRVCWIGRARTSQDAPRGACQRGRWRVGEPFK